MKTLEELTSTSEGFIELLAIIVREKRVFLNSVLLTRENGEKYYFSYDVFWWVEETYYLFEKIEKKMN